ncbi:hypothetical protein MUN88_17200 [Gracilibacillus caseinilyticus]|uniref:Uncharacterized protein n=1 Tax=Gracilibacillus caseinilyticus TaxID=2932256 RepID=A0ABY4ETL9_9BACI|nr:hypothetical protein [Gracilibacillus caseinilyticus]UOQ47769.1 hypothetical protein MUN88_17200 [Gracilibacillus caseinilyticus]
MKNSNIKEIDLKGEKYIRKDDFELYFKYIDKLIEIQENGIYVDKYMHGILHRLNYQLDAIVIDNEGDKK